MGRSACQPGGGEFPQRARPVNWCSQQPSSCRCMATSCYRLRGLWSPSLRSACPQVHVGVWESCPEYCQSGGEDGGRHQSAWRGRPAALKSRRWKKRPWMWRGCLEQRLEGHPAQCSLVSVLFLLCLFLLCWEGLGLENRGPKNR